MQLDNPKYFYWDYDLDSTTYKYGRLGGPGGLPCPAKYAATTTGPSTTVVSASSGLAFGPVGVGDILFFSIPGNRTRQVRKVVTKVSDTEITVNTAIDLGSAAPFYFLPWKVGATVNDGWHSTQMYIKTSVHIRVETIAAGGGVDYVVEINGGNLDVAGPVTVATDTLTIATSDVVTVEDVCSGIRVGLKGHDNFAGTDKITVWLTGQMRSR